MFFEVIYLECEICGAAGADKKAEVEGTELRVCEKCASLGDVKESHPRNKKAKAEKDSRSPPKFEEDSEKVLKRNYGKLVRKGRKEEDFTIEEFAKKLGEKASVIKRIEKEDLKPDKELSKKIEDSLDLELFTEFEGGTEGEESKSEKITIGDVAEVK